MVELRPAATLDGTALAALFTAGYEGYWFPIAFDAAAFALMAETMDVDLGLSRVAVEGSEPVGVALVARRGTEGWIGGMGVVTSHRRRGIGEATLVAALDAARAAGIERVTLEVLEQNEPARRLYERLGFEHVRDLEVWSCPGRTVPSRPEDGRPRRRTRVARAHRRPRPSRGSERSDALGSEQLGEPSGPGRRDATSERRAAAVVRLPRGRVAVQQAAAVDAAAAALAGRRGRRRGRGARPG